MSGKCDKFGNMFDKEPEYQDLVAFFHYREKNKNKYCFTSLMSSMLSFLGVSYGLLLFYFFLLCALGMHAQFLLPQGILYWGKG